jgi:hypothetical protein
MGWTMSSAWGFGLGRGRACGLHKSSKEQANGRHQAWPQPKAQGVKKICHANS